MPSRQTYANNQRVGSLACWIGGGGWGGGGAEKRGDTFSKKKKSPRIHEHSVTGLGT